MTRKLAILATIATVTLGLAAVPASASPLVPANKACFFQGVGFTGPAICFETGQRQFMPAEFATTISSVQVIGNVSVTLCTGRVRRGSCQTFTEDRWQVPSPLHNNAKSFQVQRDWSVSNFNQSVFTTGTMMVLPRAF